MAHYYWSRTLLDVGSGSGEIDDTAGAGEAEEEYKIPALGYEVYYSIIAALALAVIILLVCACTGWGAFCSVLCYKKSQKKQQLSGDQREITLREYRQTGESTRANNEAAALNEHTPENSGEEGGRLSREQQDTAPHRSNRATKETSYDESERALHTTEVEVHTTGHDTTDFHPITPSSLPSYTAPVTQGQHKENSPPSAQDPTSYVVSFTSLPDAIDTGGKMSVTPRMSATLGRGEQITISHGSETYGQSNPNLAKEEMSPNNKSSLAQGHRLYGGIERHGKRQDTEETDV